MQRLLSHTYSIDADILLRPNPRAALEAYIGDRREFRVAMLEPPMPDYLAVARARNCRITMLPRDPDDWEDFDFNDLDEVWLANPSPVDGFFYPSTFYTKLARYIAPFRHVRVLSDESTAVFSFNLEPPGSLAKVLGDERVALSSSLYPLMSPQGPTAAWILRRAQPGPGAVDVYGIEKEDLAVTLAVLQTFLSRQGASFSEFTRRMVALEHGFRLFADRLKPALQTQVITVPHWPETGFYVRLRCPALRKDGVKMEEACLDLAREQGLLVVPGTLFDEPDDFLVCYAAPHLILEEMAARLLRFVL